MTHGQMHAGNVVWTDDDQLLFVDWDCAAVAPRERDLGTWANDLDPKTDEDWAAYTSAGRSREIPRPSSSTTHRASVGHLRRHRALPVDAR
jgi:thiamine kinase-like enzyme